LHNRRKEFRIEKRRKKEENEWRKINEKDKKG